MNKWTLRGMMLMLSAAGQMLMADEGCYPEEKECCTETCAACQEDQCVIAEECECCQSEPCTFFGRLDPTVKLRVAAFWPSSERFHEIYGNSMPSFQVEGAVKFLDCYQAWVNVDWVYKKGSSDHLDYYTTINIGNLSFGLSMAHQLTECVSAYAGIGPSFGYIDIHNRFTREHKDESKFALGLAVKSGLIYHMSCRYFLEFFIDYLYQPTSFKTHVNVGGLKTGVGIGTHF